MDYNDVLQRLKRPDDTGNCQYKTMADAVAIIEGLLVDLQKAATCDFCKHVSLQFTDYPCSKCKHGLGFNENWEWRGPK